MIFKARVHLKPHFHGGSLVTFSMRILTRLSKMATPLTTARTLCSKGRNQRDSPSMGSGWTHTGSHRHGDTAGQRPSYPRSVFTAGTAKRTAEMLRRKAALTSLDRGGAEEEEEEEERPNLRRMKTPGRLVPPQRPLSADEWRKLKEASDNPERFDVQMMSLLFISRAELDIAKSLLTFVATETGTLSYKLLLRYLTLCVSGGHDSEVPDVYAIMRGSFPSLDTGASSLFIKGFSRTGRWREALPILRDIKKVITPSPRNYGDIIAAALRQGDTATAWALHDEVMEEGLSPHQETWQSLFLGGARARQQEREEEVMDHGERLLGVLAHMRDNQIYPQQSLAGAIETWFESRPGQKWRGGWTTVSPKGVCRCCGSELESIQLTPEEYQHLKDRVLADIIQGKDVFNKTTPEELERFKSFVERKPPFDVVVDGLNVANLVRGKQSETLLAVVSELVQQGLSVLVLGRKHMRQPSRSWDRRDMSLVQQQAHCFFTENISEDDPFLLYATLQSGNHCRFLSRDLMRDHKACLPDGLTRRLFFKWQRGHQLVVHGHVAAGRRVRFQSIPSYDTIVQSAGNSWHLPYDDTEDRSTYEVPQRWLCLTRTR